MRAKITTSIASTASAHCADSDCDFRTAGLFTVANAKKHVEQTGHRVVVDFHAWQQTWEPK